MAGDFAFLLDNCVNIFAGTAWNPPRKACLSATLTKNKIARVRAQHLIQKAPSTCQHVRGAFMNYYAALQHSFIFRKFQWREFLEAAQYFGFVPSQMFRDCIMGKENLRAGAPQTILRCIGTIPESSRITTQYSKKFPKPPMQGPINRRAGQGYKKCTLTGAFCILFNYADPSFRSRDTSHLDTG